MKISDKTCFIRKRILDKNIKGCKKINPEQMETIVQLAEEYEEAKGTRDQIDYLRYGLDLASGRDRTSLLVIELESETDVPKVIYKGKEIKLKRNVFFDWETDGAYPTEGGLTYAIEHFERHASLPTINRIERKVKGHAYD
ncbi:hypothetical protein [Virgibacillus chiguensis]|uniref:Uncharacterized protein n=1 Tax=Virgibacillus chiguensis TaxID=411959 RepID=A0A1M5XTZ7_9BACI|nr:hypothetical protein [Virgibacillus chiguensis]SHI03236.1 hypothetical protein SAMN05421807_1441 [Virgibacillus chiguensis]